MAAGVVQPESRAGQIRNPKAETRKKLEIRSLNLKDEAQSGLSFGFRASEFFRPSDLRHILLKQGENSNALARWLIPAIMCVGRSVAQLGRAPALGAGCRRFKSCRSDHFISHPVVRIYSQGYSRFSSTLRLAKYFFAAQFATGFFHDDVQGEFNFHQRNQALRRIPPRSNSGWHCRCLTPRNAGVLQLPPECGLITLEKI